MKETINNFNHMSALYEELYLTRKYYKISIKLLHQNTKTQQKVRPKFCSVGWMQFT